MTRLEFGLATTAEQAILRLPKREHPLYRTDKVFEHLVHFREAIDQMAEIAELLPIESRSIPLETSDMRDLERISFRRKPELTVTWEHLRDENPLADVFETGDNEYKWWQISEMTPSFQIPGFRLICVETNTKFSGPAGYRYDDNSQFEIMLVTDLEEAILVEDLIRNRRTIN